MASVASFPNLVREEAGVEANFFNHQHGGVILGVCQHVGRAAG